MTRNPMTSEELDALRASMVQAAIEAAVDAIKEKLASDDPMYVHDEWHDIVVREQWKGPEVEALGRELADEIAGLIRERYPDA